MADPIEAHYTPDGDDWTVAVTGRGRTLTGRAPGLIAARDRADQLVEELAPHESGHKTVVHMLNGDAVEFTTAYLTARLARTEEPTPAQPEADAETPASDEKPQEAPADKPTAEEPPAKPTEDAKPSPVPKPTPFPRTESEAARLKAQPTPTEAEQTAPSTS
jgi:hypothetical protein